LAPVPGAQIHTDDEALLAEETPPSIIDGSWKPPAVKKVE
jgi:hypothetical protein